MQWTKKKLPHAAKASFLTLLLHSGEYEHKRRTQHKKRGHACGEPGQAVILASKNVLSPKPLFSQDISLGHLLVPNIDAGVTLGEWIPLLQLDMPEVAGPHGEEVSIRYGW